MTQRPPTANGITDASADRAPARARPTWRQRFIEGARAQGEAKASDLNAGVHGARGLFAFSVLVFHVSNSGLPVWPLPGLLSGIFYSLQFGVELFFAISGFVIAGTMTRARTPTRFIVNRATRIFPVLWVNVLVIALLSAVTGRELAAILAPLPFFGVLLANLAAMPGIWRIPAFNPAAWTLSYELTFYMLCFTYLLGVKFLRWRPTLPLIAVGIVLIVLNPRALFFPCGMIVAAGWLNRPWVNALAREPLLWLAIFLACWTQVPQVDENRYLVVEPIYRWLGDARPLFAAAAFVAATLTLHGIAQGYGLLSRFLRLWPMLWLGTVSYSLYLWHPLILAIVKQVLLKVGVFGLVGEASQLLFMAIVVVPVLVTAWVSQLVLEHHATDRLRRAALSLLEGRKTGEVGSPAR